MNMDQLLGTYIRPGKLNPQFIVTARMIFKNTATMWHFSPAPSSAAIEGRGLGDHEFEPSVSYTVLLV